MKKTAEEIAQFVTMIANVGIFAQNTVLLVRYRHAPDRQNGWFLPHDVVEPFADPDLSAASILSTQLGIADTTTRLNHIESFRGNNGTWHISLHYKTELSKIPDHAPIDSVAEYRWFPLNALPDRSEVSHHGWALDNIQVLLEKREATSQ